MKKNLIVKQDGYKECGAASLLSIIVFMGIGLIFNGACDLIHVLIITIKYQHFKRKIEEEINEQLEYQAIFIRCARHGTYLTSESLVTGATTKCSEPQVEIGNDGMKEVVQQSS